jgi:hypothetical protein
VLINQKIQKTSKKIRNLEKNWTFFDLQTNKFAGS